MELKENKISKTKGDVCSEAEEEMEYLKPV
jgi:hypothetical protein